MDTIKAAFEEVKTPKIIKTLEVYILLLFNYKFNILFTNNNLNSTC